MDCSAEWSDDDVYLCLAASLTAHTDNRDSSLSENEPLMIASADSEFNTSDNIPLSHYRHLVSNDSSGSDPTYQPEEAPAFLEKFTQRRRKRSRKERDLCQAIAKSKAQTEVVANDRMVHQQRLDNLLSANGLQRVEVASDGNCFFESCALSLNMEALDLRKCLCDYLEDNLGMFIEFMPFAEDENDRYLEYMHNVVELRHPGRWSNHAGDMLPLALASWTNRNVRLYTSNPNHPILDVYPMGITPAGQNDATMIALALLEYPGAPHYNACTNTDKVITKAPHSSTQADQFLTQPCHSGHQPLSSLQPPSEQSEAHQSPPPHQVSLDLETDPSVVQSLPHERPPVSFQHSPLHEQSPAVQPTPDKDDLADLQCPPRCSTLLLNPQASPPSRQQSLAVQSQQSPSLQKSPERCSAQETASAALPETPRKSGTFKTPPKKMLTRKRIARPETWKKNVRKVLRLQGKVHLSDKGKPVPAKQLKETDCSKCKLKCNRLKGKREEIFRSFYALDSYEKQKHFVCTHITAKKTKTLHNDETNEAYSKTRHVSRQLHFTVDGQRERVCKKFFTSTLSISHNYLEHALRNSKNGVFVAQECRGRKRPHNKTPDRAVERVKTHIRTFPAVPSHYTRKDTRREYLSSDLNITKMHQLYAEECKKEGLSSVSSRQYRKIFNENFNLSFHVPKKDQCSTCAVYYNKKAEGAVTEAEEQAYQQHQKRKQKVREEKEADKQAAIKDQSKHVVTVDLQAVLQAPCGLVSQLYYKRKLSVYNFTVYSLGDGKGTCFIWDETEGKRGSCEIATCLVLYLQSLPSTVREVTIYSDCCGGQNRNQNLTAALMHAVNSIPNIEVIQQKYLETGHTHMECDSMHAAISLAKKCTSIYVPSEWDIILRVARRGKKYTVIPLKHTSFYDFKKLSASFIRNTKIDIEGRKVNWLHIRNIKLCKGQDDLMFFKTDFGAEDYRTLRLTGSSKRSRPAPLKTLPLCYNSKLPISKAKQQDLLSLCSSGIIPSHHHAFFQALPVSASAKDKLSEPDIHDSATGSDTD